MLEDDGDISNDFEFKICGIDLIKVQVKMIVGKNIEEDCSCDSGYIINIMPKVSVTMQENFHWIPKGKNYI